MSHHLPRHLAPQNQPGRPVPRALRGRRAWAVAAACALLVGGSVPAVAGSRSAQGPIEPAVSDPGVASPADVAQRVADALGAAPGEPNVEVLPTDTGDAAADAVVAETTASGVETLDLGKVAEDTATLPDPDGAVTALVTEAIATDEFSVGGMTWDEGVEPSRVLVRAQQDGTWTEWFDAVSDDGPDPDSAEGKKSKPGTGPVILAGATAVQYQVLSEPGAALPTGLTGQITTVNDDDADPAPGSPGTKATQPAIKLRSTWGARPSTDTTKFSTLKGAIVHHTAGSNTYTQAQVAGIIKGIQNYHMDGRDWADIGYNFLVDKYGGIWEGRQGGITANIQGAHAAPYNTGSTGVSYLGDTSKAAATTAGVDAIGRLVAWRLSEGGIYSLKGTTTYPNGTKPVQIVSGHRDVNATACPGTDLYSKLPTIRGYAAGRPPVDVVAPFGQIILSADMTADGRGEVLAVDKTGQLAGYPANSSGALGTPWLMGTGFTDYKISAPGDWNRDGKNDVIAITPDGNMWLFAGQGNGVIRYKVQIGNGWNGYTMIPAGDLNKDGNVDLLAIKDSTGDLYLYRGDGKGGFKYPYPKVGNGWKGYSLYAAGDVTKDGKADILSVDSKGDLYMYGGRGDGTFRTRIKVGNGWTGYLLAVGADLNGDGMADLVGRDNATRKVFFYRATGGGKFATKKEIAQGW